MKKHTLTLVSIVLLFAPGLLAQETADVIENIEPAKNVGNREKTGRRPYEIVVTPTLSRTGLRDLITKVEEDFYEKFNELNTDKDYDIVCYKYTPTGSYIWRRVCEPMFMYRSRGDIASFVTFLLTSGNIGARQSAGAFARSDREITREKSSDFDTLQSLMEEFSNSDVEFREIGEVLAELKRRLENYDN